jgi:hypothetical protein
MQGTGTDLTGDLLTAVVAAPVERKEAALLLLRGEAEITMVSATTEPVAIGPEPYLTLKACAVRLGVSSCSLWRWGVPGHELGGRRRFRVTEVAAYLESAAFRERVEELKAGRRGQS